MVELLDRLQGLAKLLAGTSLRLNPGASPQQLDKAEATMGIRLPDDVRAAYLRFDGMTREPWVHGSDNNPPMGPALFLPFYDWASCDRMVTHWQTMVALRERLIADGTWADTATPDMLVHSRRHFWRAWPMGWHPRWIPIGELEAQPRVFIDLAPGPAGRSGQLIQTHDGGDLNTEVIAESFGDYLERFLNGVESGRLLPSKAGSSWEDGQGRFLQRLTDANL